jgi:outer membrane protein assembly factor BamB
VAQWTLRAFFVLLAFVWSVPLRADNWPRFRGPTGQGMSDDKKVPVRWSNMENVAWKTPLPGQGWSSPIVWGDQVFVTATTDDGVSCHVIAVNRRDGKIQWDREVFKQKPSRKEQRNSYATPTPVTDGRRVYAFFAGGGAAAVNCADGNVAWTNTEHEFYSQHGLGASPILYKDSVIMPFDWSSPEGDKTVGWQKPWDRSFVLALDVNTGKVKWRAKRGLSRIAHVTPQVVEVGGKPVLVSGAGDVIQGFNPDTSELLWTARSQGEGVVPSIVVGDGLVFTSSGFEKSTIRAVKLDPAAKGDVTQSHIAWEQSRAVPTVPSFIHADGLLFTLKENGIVLCIDAKTGEIVWQERIEGNFAASPVYANGNIYFVSMDGECVIIKASRRFEEVARNQLHEQVQASPAISRGQLFIRTNKHLYCIGTGASARAER